MEPRLANIRSARLSACLLVTLLFLDSQETSAQRCIPLGWPGYRWLISCADLKLVCILESNCVFAVSLISTAANSAGDGELGVERRQRRAGAAVGWQEGTRGKKKWVTLVIRIAAHGFAFFTGGFIQCQHMWRPRNKVSLFVACEATQSCLEPSLSFVISLTRHITECSVWYTNCCLSVYSRHQTRSWTRRCFQLHTTPVAHFPIWPTSSSLLRCPPRWTPTTPWPSPCSARPTARAAWPPTSPTSASALPATVMFVECFLLLRFEMQFPHLKRSLSFFSFLLFWKLPRPVKVKNLEYKQHLQKPKYN